MSDGEPELAAFVRRTRRTLDGGDLSAANTDLRVVLPLLKTLGWDVHGPEVVADHPVSLDAPVEVADGTADSVGAGVTTADTGSTPPPDAATTETVVVDFALTLDGRPTTFVVTDGTDTPLSSAHGRRLGAAMDAAGVERGLVTNGRSFVFVDAADGTLREESCALAELPDRASLLALYTKRAARERARRRRAADRAAAADGLRERRATTVEAVATALAGDRSGPVADELATAAEGLVDGVVTALAAGDHPATAVTAADAVSEDAEPPVDEPAPTDADPAPDPAGDGTDDSAVDAPDADTNGITAAGDGGGTAEDTADTGAGTATEGTDAAEEQPAGTDPRDEAAPMARNRGGDEYVARFFDDRSSVGAVGNATSGGCVAQAVQYLAQRHALDNRLDLPWAPEDAGLDPGRAVVNREPTHGDGHPMQSPVQVGDGHHVETALDPATARAVVESLADRTGLRVMFQGEW